MSFGSVWVIAESVKDQVAPISLQLIAKSKLLADELGQHVECVLLGKEVRSLTDTLIAAGADQVYLGDSNSLENYNSELFLEIIYELALDHQPEIILLGSTFMGRELAPLLAAKLRTGLSAHCIDLVINDDMDLEQKIPAYGGLMTIICPENRPQMATVADGVFPLPILDDKREGVVVEIKIPEDFSQRIEVIDIVQTSKERVSLESAEVIVAGGAGAGDLAGWGEIVKLANLLNAGLGSTRPAVDIGWTELDTMIGQSGKMVNPNVYIGIGLSGELQHMVGLVGPKVMIAINNEAKSPIFEQVDFGIVADCREFVPILIKKLKEMKDKK
jgi:electron transfer flavoprotein alpha subunit